MHKIFSIERKNLKEIKRGKKKKKKIKKEQKCFFCIKLKKFFFCLELMVGEERDLLMIVI
jgi:hypothetical protein